MAAEQDMNGRCHHVTLRLRILLLLFTAVLFYSITWLFNFRVVTKYGKTLLDSSGALSRLAMNHSFGNTNRDTAEHVRPIYLNKSTKSEQTNTVNEVVTSNITFHYDKYKSVGQYRDIGVKELKYVDNYTNGDDKYISKNIRDNQEWVLSDISKRETDNSELTKSASNKFTTERSNSQVLIGRVDKGLTQNKSQPSLIKLSLNYKPKAVTESPKLIPVLKQNQNKYEETRIMHSETNNKTLNTAQVTNSNNTLNKALLPKQSSVDSDVDDSKGKGAADHHMNDTMLLGNKTGLELRNETSKTANSSAEQLFERKTFASCKYPLHESDKFKVGILIPTSTRKILSPSLKNLSLIKTSLPSIYETLEEKFIYRIYLGIDEGDFLETVQDELQTMFDCVIPVIVHGKNYVKSVNTIAERAYTDGMDYFVRTNDDTCFVTKNWTSVAINKLRDYHPENIGVVGPTCKEGNTKILTHDMVHRQHLEIFDFYYPPYLENWWTDDWITQVYEPRKVTKLTSWVVKHIMLDTRYTVDFERQKWADTLIKYDKSRLNTYIGCNCDKCENSAHNTCITMSGSKTLTMLITLLPCFILIFLEYL